MLELGKDLLDGVQVRAIGRQEQQSCTGAADCFADGGPFVAAQIVHDYDIPGSECGHEELLDIFKEAGSVDRLIEDARGIDPVATQCGKEGHRPPVTIGYFGMQPLTLGCPAAQGRHIGLGPGFINENKPPWINPALEFLPLIPPPGDLRAQLFGGQNAFF